MKSPLSVLVLICTTVVQSPVCAGHFRAGAAVSNITPDIGSKIIGGFVPFPSTHIHDDLHARCLVLSDGETTLALVVCDLLGIDRVVSDSARRHIARRHGIPRECVMISATHTHSASSALGEDSRKLNQPADDYQRFVARRIADGVTRAMHHMRPAQLAFGTAEAPEHVFNRRWHMRPGTVPLNPFGATDTVKMNPPRASANLVKPAGPVDPTVSFLAVREPTGRPIAVFASYSLHYVGGVGRGHISADYFGVFSHHLQRLMSVDRDDDTDAPPLVAMMANGTSGDINNIHFRKPRPRRKRYEQMRVVGRDVAEKVHAAMDSLSYRDDVALAAAYREPQIAWRRPTPQQRRWAAETIAAGKKSDRDLSYIYAERMMQMAQYPESTTVPLQVLNIGNICLATMPFEVFCETGLEFKSRCPIQPAFMVELAHGYLGYLPTPRQHRLGGYETWLGTNRVEREASDKLLKILLDMAAELKTETIAGK